VKKHRTTVVGVTGGIGSGKSRVCGLLRRLGVEVVSADDLAKELMEGNARLKKLLIRSFGNGIYRDGKLRRQLLASIVFSSSRQKRKIDRIVHPMVISETKRRIRATSTDLLVVEAALIFESGVDEIMDYIVVVDARQDLRLRRVMERDGVSRADVLRRTRFQLPARDLRRRADIILSNNGTLRALDRKARFLFNLLSSLSKNV
jgi:dephospho-CoA kinase